MDMYEDKIASSSQEEESEYAQAHVDAIRRIDPVSILYLRSEDTKGARWMPWHRKSMKDAASCDKLRGGANIL